MDLPGLKNNRECSRKLSLLRYVPGLFSVVPNTRTGRMLVLYAPERITAPAVLSVIRTALDLKKEYVDALQEVSCVKDPGRHLPRHGLTEAEALERRRIYGPNQLPPVKKPGLIRLFTGQFDGFLARTLVASAIVSIMARETVNAVSIFGITAINAVFSAYQEYNSEKAMEAVNRLVEPTARVVRNGETKRIPAPGLVPGDLVLLEQGNRVPADMLVIKASNLCAEESSLTGESCPVDKTPAVNPETQKPSNTLYMGTNICRGKAEGIVISTVPTTAMGRISMAIKEERVNKTGLQNEIYGVGKTFIKVSSSAGLAVLTAELFRGGFILPSLVDALSLAVSSIPEGLPTMVTIAQASGVTALARRGAIARKLPSVENVGKTTMVCFDKTGTLTMNVQTLKYIYTGYSIWSISENSRHPAAPAVFPGAFRPSAGNSQASDLYSALRCSVLCNDARISRSGSPGGDPLDAALLSAAGKSGVDVSSLRNKFPRVDEIPFDPLLGRMTVVCRHGCGDYFAFVKGSPHRVLDRCGGVLCSGKTWPASGAALAAIKRQIDLLAGNGCRVLALAQKQLSRLYKPDYESDLIFIGLAAFHDPPRPDARKVLRQLRQADIKTAIITGDNCKTALALAEKLGPGPKARAITGAQLERISPQELPRAVREIEIFAEVLPEQKLKIIEALKQTGEVVVMVGDGVNDAPAVKQADIGMAMDGMGADVTRHTADIVIAGGGLEAVVETISQGRLVHRKIKSTLEYLLAANVAELTIAFIPLLTGLRSALPPAQMFWLNILSDGLPALALTVARPSGESLYRDKAGGGFGAMDKGMSARAICRGLTTGATGLFFLVIGHRRGDLYRARTMSMAAVIARQIIHARECGGKSPGRSVRYLLAATALLFLTSVYFPGLGRLFKTTSLGLADWVAVMAAVYASSRLDGVCPGRMNKGGGK